jgi:hypothetical protein
MDDRELEARLQQHLHQRFDVAPVPSGLVAAVRDGMLATPTAKVGFAFRPRSFQVGWAATLVVVIAVGALLLAGRGLGPATPRATHTPSSTPVPTQPIVERHFIVLAPNRTWPSAADREAATQVLVARLAGLGMKATESDQTAAIEFTMEGDGLPDDAIRRILAATGEIEFVPLPEADYGDGKLIAEVGKPLPRDEPALFGWEGIESVEQRTDQQDRPMLNFTLKPAARQAFADYTTNHLQGYLAIVIDGRVALLPVINEPITGGEVAISGGGLPGSPEATRFDEAIAVLVGGRLPEAWQGASVPPIMTREAAIEAARASGQGGSGAIEGADLDALLDDARWRPVWRVSVAGGAVVTLDAVTGAWLSTFIS